MSLLFFPTPPAAHVFLGGPFHAHACFPLGFPVVSLPGQLKQQQLADIAGALQKERDVVERYKQLKFV